MMELRLIANAAILSMAVGFAPQINQPAFKLSALAAEADPIASTADAIIGKVCEIT